MVLRQRMRQRCAKSYQINSTVAMVPGAGIEPARLAAGDFESHPEMSTGAACRPVFGASDPLGFQMIGNHCANGILAFRMHSRSHADPPSARHFSHSESVMRTARGFISSPVLLIGLRPWLRSLMGLVIQRMYPRLFGEISPELAAAVTAHRAGTITAPNMPKKKAGHFALPASALSISRAQTL